jgi:hypothetical protein
MTNLRICDFCCATSLAKCIYLSLYTTTTYYNHIYIYIYVCVCAHGIYVQRLFVELRISHTSTSRPVELKDQGRGEASKKPQDGVCFEDRVPVPLKID